MIFGSPVRGTIAARLTAHRFYRSQREGCVTSTLEPRLGACLHFHRGTDVSHADGACGRDVLAMAPGTVFYVGKLNDGVNVVTIRHSNGWATGYAHCRGIVHQGQKVTKGQQIGDMDQSGVATGCHCHVAVKKDFPSGADVNDFWLDDPKYGLSGLHLPGQPDKLGTGKGTWVDVWPLLAQNVTVNPKPVPSGIRIRTAPKLGDSTIYAETNADGHIYRDSDAADLGLTATERSWGGTVAGDYYTIGNSTSNKWEKIWLASAYRYIASLLAELSV